MSALRVLLEPRRHWYHLPWLDSVRGDLDRLHLWPLLVLSPRCGWTPDFLSPAPAGPGTGYRRSARPGRRDGAGAGSQRSGTLADRAVRGSRVRGGLAAAR